MDGSGLGHPPPGLTAAASSGLSGAAGHRGSLTSSEQQNKGLKPSQNPPPVPRKMAPSLSFNNQFTGLNFKFKLDMYE